MAKERFDVAAAVEDVKYRRVFFLEAIRSMQYTMT
jgi:hypothetical protein